MAKPPKKKTRSSTQVGANSIELKENTVTSLLNSVGLTTGTITVSDGSIKIKGTRPDNTRITIEKRTINNYQEQTATIFAGTSVRDRQRTAIKLREQGLTQQNIADKLGVSQKTVSNYLKDSIE